MSRSLVPEVSNTTSSGVVDRERYIGEMKNETRRVRVCTDKIPADVRRKAQNDPAYFQAALKLGHFPPLRTEPDGGPYEVLVTIFWDLDDPVYDGRLRGGDPEMIAHWQQLYVRDESYWDGTNVSEVVCVMTASQYISGTPVIPGFPQGYAYDVKAIDWIRGLETFETVARNYADVIRGKQREPALFTIVPGTAEEVKARKRENLQIVRDAFRKKADK